jgi:hypothetical protein
VYRPTFRLIGDERPARQPDQAALFAQSREASERNSAPNELLVSGALRRDLDCVEPIEIPPGLIVICASNHRLARRSRLISMAAGGVPGWRWMGHTRDYRLEPAITAGTNSSLGDMS